MARFKSILKRHQVEIAQRQRACAHGKSRRITKGEACLVVFDGDQRRFCYSSEVGMQMIAQAQEELQQLKAELTAAGRRPAGPLSLPLTPVPAPAEQRRHLHPVRASETDE